MNRIAVIVIGSNSTRVLAADACEDLTNEMRGRAETRLFLGMTEDGIISNEAMHYTVQCVSELKKSAESTGAQLLGIYATSASRDAKNSAALSALIKAETGHSLTILSGDEEAAYSFFGAAGHDRCGVIDIGGGSTEVVLGEGMCIACAKSMQLGASRLFKEQPVNCLNDVEKARYLAQQTIRTLPSALIRHESVNKFVLIGGTGTSIARLLGEKPENCTIGKETVEILLKKIAETPRDKRADIPNFPSARIDILPTGMTILLALMDELKLGKVTVSERVNADGLLRSFVHKKFA